MPPRRAVLTHMFSPSRMARRVQLLEQADIRQELAQLPAASVQLPTLIVTGEPSLDRVVPVAATHEYLRHLAAGEPGDVLRAPAISD